MRYAMAFAAALMVSLTAPGAGNIDFGTVELSGTASFSHSSSDYISQTGFSLNPSLAVYVTPFMNVGPVLGWSGYTTDYAQDNSSDYSVSTLQLGGKLGFLVNWSDGFGRPLPFFDLGSGMNFISQDYASSSSGNNAFYQAVAGMKLKIGECFYLSLFESYTHDGSDLFDNQFRSGAGFSGLIGR